MDAVTLPPAELQALLSELSQRGVHLSLQDGLQLAVRAPKGGVSQDLLARLRECKNEVVQWLQRSATADASALPQIVPNPQSHHEPCPLGDLQTAFAMGDGADMEFHVRPHYYVETEWPGLDPARYIRTVNQVLYRQRANLFTLGDDMQLHPLPRFEPVQIPVHDLRALSPEQQQQALQAMRAEWSRRTLPLDRWPWFDCAISLYGDDQARLHWNNNNFFSDGYGGRRLQLDIRRLYEDPALELPELSLSYRDCVLALQRIEESALGERSRRYWMDRLPALPGPPPVPLRPGLNPRMRSWLERRDATLPEAQWSALKAAAQRHGITATNVLFAAYAEVLARWSGSRHFLLNNMITHRLPLHPEIRDVLGNFASLYPLEVDWRDEASFADRARKVQTRITADLQHTHWSGVKVLQALNQAQKAPGRAPCPFVVGSGLFMARLPRPFYGCLETSQVMLDHQFWELEDGGLWIVWDVIEACFPEGLVNAMWDAYRGLLVTLAQDPQAWDRTGFDLLPADQRARRDHINDTRAPLPAGLLHDGLAQGMQRWPERAAVIDAQRTLSYAQLHAHANRLAHALRAAGVQRGDRVPVLLDKGWHQAVAVYGVLRAGAAYVPVDPAWPDARIEHVLASVQAAHVVTRHGFQKRVPAALQAWCVDDSELGRHPGTTPEAVQRPEDLAYVLFTSGSTGQPKGVMIDHRGALNTVVDINQRMSVGEGDVVFGVSSLCFDLSVYDLFGTLAAGGTLVLPASGEPDPVAWLAQARQHGVTVWNSVPALMQLLVEAAQAADVTLPALRTVMLSGDWIPVSLPAHITQRAPNARVHSLGGATEASIWSIHYPVADVDPAWPSIPYGRPMANQRWHVLHDDGHDAPDGVPGHLHIAGDGLALGYWQDEAKTKAAFIQHPHTGERLYRTGDLGRWLPGGDIEFLGRADFQVKVQGYRVELGEIEHALLAHPGVGNATVLATGGAAGRQLVAFAVPASHETPDTNALLLFLRERLPAYMVPVTVMWLDALPLTPTGKLDRQALGRMSLAAPSSRAQPVAPRTPLEAAIAAIWQEVLELPEVSVHDDFFDLGGQSFAALRVITRVSQFIGRRVPLSALLEGRTVAKLAEAAGRAQAWSPLVVLQREGSGTPCCFVHPAGGNVVCYRALAQRLGRPFYALQAPGGASLPDTVEAMAELYLQALRQQQPHGPYVLGGWSSGGPIAFEMARQLEQRGERVEQVILIDAPSPVQHAAVESRHLTLWFLEDLNVGIHAAALPVDELPAGATPSQQLAAALALANRRLGITPAIGLDLLDPIHAVFRTIVNATRMYRPPQASLRADVTVVRPTESRVSEFADHPDAQADDWGWGRFTRGRVHTGRMAGHHHTLLAAASVQNLIALIGEGP